MRVVEEALEVAPEGEISEGAPAEEASVVVGVVVVTVGEVGGGGVAGVENRGTQCPLPMS